MLTDKIAQTLLPMYLSGIKQEDAYQILVRALGGTAWNVLDSFSHCTTDAVCSFYRTNRASILKIRNDAWDKLELDGCYIVQGEALRKLRRATNDTLLGHLEVTLLGHLEVTFWTPRAMLRLATYLQNPIASSVQAQIAAFAASKTASNWRINEGSTLQESDATSLNETPPSQPPDATLRAELGSILGGCI
jgi:hypothetical protein